MLALGLLLPFTLFVSFLWLIGRADTVAEVAIARMRSWTVLGPVWAVLVFILLGAWLRTNRRRWLITIGGTMIAWVAVAAVGSWWEGRKWDIRMERAQKFRKQAVLTPPARGDLHRAEDEILRRRVIHSTAQVTSSIPELSSVGAG